MQQSPDGCSGAGVGVDGQRPAEGFGSVGDASQPGSTGLSAADAVVADLDDQLPVWG